MRAVPAKTVGLAIIGALACAAGGITAGRTLLPGVVLIDRHETYEVNGDTVGELVASIRENGPRVEDHGFGASTRWSVRWSYSYGRRGAECRVTRADVELEVVVTSPIWLAEPDVSAELIDTWTAFTVALDAHEAGHREHGVEAAREVRDALDEARSTSCLEMERETNAAVRKIIARYHRRDVDYDLETEHGRTQGAALKPIAGTSGGT